MTERAKEETEVNAMGSASPKRKKPYVKPVLRPLGSVRELTLGGGASPHSDGMRATRVM
ncbi:MAG: lasso RiPP family leader peptide-containing protein [Myxococcota bacterium]|nr:lasso RiPP family leader peptide-containing protein [Myxococcota bacterium]